MLTCWGPVGIHSACTWQPPWWMRQLLASGARDTGMRGLGSAPIYLSTHMFTPYPEHPQAPHLCMPLSPSWSDSGH